MTTDSIVTCSNNVNQSECGLNWCKDRKNLETCSTNGCNKKLDIDIFTPNKSADNTVVFRAQYNTQVSYLRKCKWYCMQCSVINASSEKKTQQKLKKIQNKFGILNCGHIAGSCTVYKKHDWPKYVCSYNNINIYTKNWHDDSERVTTLLKPLEFDSIQWTVVNDDPTEIDYFFSTFKCTIFKKIIDTKTQYWIQMHPLTNRIYFLFEYITASANCIFYETDHRKIKMLLNQIKLEPFNDFVVWCKSNRNTELGVYLDEISHYEDCTFVAEQSQAKNIHKQIKKDVKLTDVKVEFEENFNTLFFRSGIEVNMLIELLKKLEIKEIDKAEIDKASTNNTSGKKIELLHKNDRIKQVFIKKLEDFCLMKV